MIHHGDCLDVMAAMEPESVDAIVTDPPYGLEFMGKEWDKLWNGTRTAKAGGRVGSDGVFRRKTQPTSAHGRGAPTYRAGREAQEFHARWAEAAFRVAKPSAYLLAFGGTRTVHRMTVALEDAGWIIRDMLVWAYASGFPKSKASLKPAWEPIVMARKPGPLRELAIDACRIPASADDIAEQRARTGGEMSVPDGRGIYGAGNRAPAGNEQGRWPANVILTSPIFDGGWDGVVGGGEAQGSKPIERPEGFVRFNGTDYGGGAEYVTGGYTSPGYGDSGTYSRFFLLPRGATCDWCGASNAGPSSDPRSRRDASAPDPAATGASSDATTRTGARTTSGTATPSSSGGSGPTTRTRSSRGSRPAEPSLSSDPANNAARLGTSSATTPTTASPRLCSSCAADATHSSMDEREFAASRSYPRWFLIPKADRADREPVLGGLPERVFGGEGHALRGERAGESRDNRARQNVHPTVKPTELMRHLVRLVTPPGGTVLDPFLGSGTTALAAEAEGFPWLGIEREAEYVAIAEARLNGTQRGLGLTA